MNAAGRAEPEQLVAGKRHDRDRKVDWLRRAGSLILLRPGLHKARLRAESQNNGDGGRGYTDIRGVVSGESGTSVIVEVKNTTWEGKSAAAVDRLVARHIAQLESYVYSSDSERFVCAGIEYARAPDLPTRRRIERAFAAHCLQVVWLSEADD